MQIPNHAWTMLECRLLEVERLAQLLVHLARQWHFLLRHWLWLLVVSAAQLELRHRLFCGLVVLSVGAFHRLPLD